MKTIYAYGYEVTGINEIIAEIEEDLKDKSLHINWKNFNGNIDRFWNKNGTVGYPVFVNETEKKVFIGNYIEYTNKLYTVKSVIVGNSGLLNI